jgi:NAD(P)-dependent dehydrogenase (short-subunit alcohol dehydrogenase family)
MRVLIAGAGGLIGSAVAAQLASKGHEVVRLVRREPGPGKVRWDPDAGTVRRESRASTRLSREFLSLTLSIDHDIVEGAPTARFTARLKELIESGAILSGLRPSKLRLRGGDDGADDRSGWQSRSG